MKRSPSVRFNPQHADTYIPHPQAEKVDKGRKGEIEIEYVLCD